jgi:hypothetical protein
MKKRQNNVEWFTNDYVIKHFFYGILGLIFGIMLVFLFEVLILKKNIVIFFFVIIIIIISTILLLIYFNKKNVPRKIGISKKGIHFQFVNNKKFVNWNNIESIQYNIGIFKKHKLQLKSNKIFILNFVDDKIIKLLKEFEE